MKIWLDDERPAPEGWIWCKGFDGLIPLLADNWERIEEISFDHDLGEGQKDGTEITKWMLTNLGYKFRLIYHLKERNHWRNHRWKWKVHSSNPVGRANMESNLRQMDRIWDENAER